MQPLAADGMEENLKGIIRGGVGKCLEVQKKSKPKGV
jgi:hypothetical protein